MQLEGLIHTFPKHIKLFIAAFVLMLSLGYGMGLFFVSSTNSTYPSGMEENYLGNENDDNAEVMKFKKSEREILTTLHTHILSLSFIFFFLGGLLALTSLPKKLKIFLMIEPFLSILLTFGGIYLMWKGVLWMKYVVMVSGIVMTIVFSIGAGSILFQLMKKE